MNETAIAQALDDAVNMMALGAGREMSADMPASLHELGPLLQLAQELLACAQQSEQLLHDAARSRGPIDWVALLADVPQTEGDTSVSSTDVACTRSGLRTARPRAARAQAFH